MYRVYAQDRAARINLGIRRRLAPLLENNRRRLELLIGVLLSLPGTPVIYYGDEIGMGDNIYLGDRNGVRTPMQWSGDRNAGFSRVNPQRLYQPVIIDPEYHYQTVNVENQQNNPSSLLWGTKRVIALRKRYQSFGRGTMEMLSPANPKILAYIRRYRQETILVVANLARYIQWVELDLAQFKSLIPVELFAQTRFPAIGDEPYFLTLGPYSFYWFSLEPGLSSRPLFSTAASVPGDLPVIQVLERWENVFQSQAVATLEEVLPNYLRARRGFGGKAGHIVSTKTQELIPAPFTNSVVYLVLVHVTYTEGDPETYFLPLTFVPEGQADTLINNHPQALVARLEGDANGFLFDAVWDARFCWGLLDSIAAGQTFAGQSGQLSALPTDAEARTFGSSIGLSPVVKKTEQNNTTIVFGNRLILKLFRCTEEGINADLEISRFLSVKCGFTHTPRLRGALEYVASEHEPMTLGILHSYVPNTETAWEFTLDCLSRYFERALASPPMLQGLGQFTRTLLEHTAQMPPSRACDMIEGYLEAAELLGRRTAELHLVLASDREDPHFAPEAFTVHYQRSVYQSMRNVTSQGFQMLHRTLKELPNAIQTQARNVLNHEGEIIQRYRSILHDRITAMRIRCHGDYHLGQVLYTGKDFLIIDFEGDPSRSVSERRLKRSPLRDVAAMLRSFHYCASAVLLGQATGLVLRPEDVVCLEPWANYWYLWVSSRFLKSYLQTAADAPFLPQTPPELQVLLDCYLLEKTVHELAYDLTNRPDWVRVPLRGLLQMLENPS